MNKYLKVISYLTVVSILCMIFGGAGLLIPKYICNIEDEHVLMLVSKLTELIGVLVIFFINKRVAIITLTNLKLNKQKLGQSFKFLLLVFLSFIAIVGVSYIFNIVDVKDIIQLKYSRIIIYLAVAFAIALNEEIIFRGLIASYLKYITNYKTAIIISSFLFAISHVQYSAVLPFITALLAGIIFSIITFKHKSLLPAIAFHMSWDFSYFLFEDIFEVTQVTPIWGEVFEIPQIMFLVCILGYFIYRNSIFPKIKK